jgi:hypothetical protein
MPPNNSLDASGGSASRNLLDPAEGALIRAAASTQPFGRITSVTVMVIATILGIALLVGYTGTRSVPTPATECPLAVLSCQKSSAGNLNYNCSVAAQMSSPKYAPQYEWSVSNGKVLGNRKLPNVTIDLVGVKSETVIVTLKVHWKNVPRICDRTLTDTIDLHAKDVSNREAGRTNRWTGAAVALLSSSLVRWTGAAVALLSSSLVRRGLNDFAPPGQLDR